MANVRVNAKLIPAPGGKSDVQLDLLPEGASLFVVLVVNSESARNISVMLAKLADAAEMVVHVPAPAIIRPPGA